jgi:hypothetical protein
MVWLISYKDLLQLLVLKQGYSVWYIDHGVGWGGGDQTDPDHTISDSSSGLAADFRGCIELLVNKSRSCCPNTCLRAPCALRAS